MNTGKAAAPNNTDKKVIFKHFAPFTTCISRINNTQIDDAQYIYVVMPMYNLKELSDNYSKTSGILWQYYREELAFDDDGSITDFTANNVTDPFNLKVKLTGQTANNDTKNVEIMVPLKYLSKFWQTLEMPLINCENTLDLNWSENCVTLTANVAQQTTTFSVTDTNIYVPV